MNASKENCITAAKHLREVVEKYKGIGTHLGFVVDFLTAAYEQLPCESTFEMTKQLGKSKKPA